MGFRSSQIFYGIDLTVNHKESSIKDEGEVLITKCRMPKNEGKMIKNGLKE